MNFEELLHKLTPKLKGIVFRLQQNSCLLGFDDLYQEALKHLWMDFRERKLEGKTDSFILQGCYFYLRNYIRKNCDSHRLLSLELEQEDGEVNPESLITQKNYFEIRDSINGNLIIDEIKNNGFTEREKEVFLLLMEGFTVRQIGSRLGISHVRVVKMKQNLKRKCRKYLDFGV